MHIWGNTKHARNRTNKTWIHFCRLVVSVIDYPAAVVGTPSRGKGEYGVSGIRFQRIKSPSLCEGVSGETRRGS